MSNYLKKFVVSGIQDAIEGRLGRSGGGNNNSSNVEQQSQGMSGYNQNYGNAGNAGYQQGGYPPQQGGYPPQQGSGYPPQQGGYPPQPGSGYPPQQGGYPLQQGGYPPQQGYPQQPSYPPQSAPGYPPQTGHQQQPPYPGGGSAGYPQAPGIGFNTGGGYPPQQPGYGAAGHQPSYGGFPPQQSYGAPGNFQGQGGPPAMFGIGNPSVVPLPGFNANQDAETLRKAMKGIGCNNSKVVAVLCARTNFQRQEISKAFKVMYGKDLIKELKSELSGDFEDLILALMEVSAIYDAKQLHKAMEGLGTKESVLIEIMTSRTNQQIAAVRDAYRALYKRELEKDLIGETSGFFKRLLVSLCAGGRDESTFMDPLRANQDARRLYSAGEKRLGTDEAMFNAILASQNFNQLRLVFDEYQKVANHPIEKAIESEFSGDIRDGMMAVVAVVRNRPAYFAKLLHDSMKGMGTRDNDLIRLVVTRAEYDMADIRTAFQALFRTSLENMIKGDCSGAYKEGLITLVNGNMNAPR